MWFALLGCGEAMPRYDPREPIDEAVRMGLAALPPLVGVRVVGEDHRSSLAPRLILGQFEVDEPDCLLLEVPEHRQRSLDAYQAGRTPRWCLGRRCPDPEGWWEEQMIRAARARGILIFAIDRFPADLPRRLDEEGLTDELRVALVDDRNLEMADTAATLWEEGTCTTAVMRVGRAHVDRASPNGGPAIPGLLESLGVPVTAVVVDDRPEDGMPERAFPVVDPPDAGGVWRFGLSAADQAEFWYARQVAVERSDPSGTRRIHLAGRKLQEAIGCLSRTTPDGRIPLAEVVVHGPPTWDDDGTAWRFAVTTDAGTSTYELVGRSAFRDGLRRYRNECLWTRVIGAARSD